MWLEVLGSGCFLSESHSAHLCSTFPPRSSQRHGLHITVGTGGFGDDVGAAILAAQATPLPEGRRVAARHAECWQCSSGKPLLSVRPPRRRREESLRAWGGWRKGNQVPF